MITTFILHPHAEANTMTIHPTIGSTREH